MKIKVIYESENVTKVVVCFVNLLCHEVVWLFYTKSLNLLNHNYFIIVGFCIHSVSVMIIRNEQNNEEQ